MKYKILNSFSTFFPYLIIFVIAIGFIVSFLINRIDLTVRALGIGISALFAAVVIIINRKRWTDNETFFHFRFISQRNLFLLFIVLFILSISALVIIDYRPWYYFVLIVAMGLVIFTQVLGEKPSAPLVILELVLLSLNLSLGTTLKYPLYFGATDLMGHMFYSKITFLSGHIIPNDISFGGYNFFPLYHIFITESANVFGIPLNISLCVITGTAFSLNVIFVYLFLKQIINNQRLSLLACLFYSFNWMVIIYNSYVVTRVFAFIGFTFILYLVTKFKGENRLIYRVIAIFMTLFVLLTHGPSFPFFIIVMALLLMLEYFVGSEHYFASPFIIIFATIYIIYSLYTAGSFTKQLLVTQLSTKMFDSTLIKQSIQPSNEYYFLYTNIDIFIYLFISLVGIGFMLQKRKRNYILVLSLFALVMFLISIPNPIQMIRQVTDLFLFERIILIVTPFLALVMAFGIYVLWKHQGKSNSARFITSSVLFTVVTVYLFASVALHGASDCDDFTWKEPRQYFVNAELLSFNYIENYVPYGSNLYSDYYTSRFFIQTKFSESEELGLPYYNSQTILNLDTIPKYHGYIIFRKEEFEEEGLFFGPYDTLKLSNVEKHPLDSVHEKLGLYNKIFSNQSVDIYF